jgi:hypothetical protein
MTVRFMPRPAFRGSRIGFLVQWLGPRRMRSTIDEYTVRDGGRWRYVHRDGEATSSASTVFHGPRRPIDGQT